MTTTPEGSPGGPNRGYPDWGGGPWAWIWIIIIIIIIILIIWWCAGSGWWGGRGGNRPGTPAAPSGNPPAAQPQAK